MGRLAAAAPTGRRARPTLLGGLDGDEPARGYIMDNRGPRDSRRENRRTAGGAIQEHSGGGGGGGGPGSGREEEIGASAAAGRGAPIGPHQVPANMFTRNSRSGERVIRKPGHRKHHYDSAGMKISAAKPSLAPVLGAMSAKIRTSAPTIRRRVSSCVGTAAGVPRPVVDRTRPYDAKRSVSSVDVSLEGRCGPAARTAGQQLVFVWPSMPAISQDGARRGCNQHKAMPRHHDRLSYRGERPSSFPATATDASGFAQRLCLDLGGYRLSGPPEKLLADLLPALCVGCYMPMAEEGALREHAAASAGVAFQARPAPGVVVFRGRWTGSPRRFGRISRFLSSIKFRRGVEIHLRSPTCPFFQR